MTNPAPHVLKTNLRKVMRRVLAESTESSGPVCRRIATWLRGHGEIRRITVFSALPGEVDLSTLVSENPDHTWIYPRVVGDELVFHVIKNPDRDLAPGAFGILEPTPDLPVVPIARIDAFLCPGLAFDDAGGRLGRGSGFYDRMLARARPDAIKAGVCFPNQKVANTFMESHDICMQTIFC